MKVIKKFRVDFEKKNKLHANFWKILGKLKKKILMKLRKSGKKFKDSLQIFYRNCKAKCRPEAIPG